MMNTLKIALSTNPGETLALTPSEAIISMFEHTDEHGTLYIPAWPYDGNCDKKKHFYRCVMNWSKTDAENVVSQYRNLYAALAKIAEQGDSIRTDSDAEKLPADLQKVWNTYLRDFETGDMDVELVMDISDRMETMDMVRSIAEKIHAGIEVSKKEFSFYNDFRDTSVTEKENAMYHAYREMTRADAERRIGKRVAAYDVIIRAKRLYKLMSLTAPERILNNEAHLLAQAMAVHAYCKEMQTVDSVE